MSDTLGKQYELFNMKLIKQVALHQSMQSSEYHTISQLTPAN